MEPIRAPIINLPVSRDDLLVMQVRMAERKLSPGDVIALKLIDQVLSQEEVE